MKFEQYPGKRVPVMEEQEKQEDHLMEMIKIRNQLYEDLGDASDENVPRERRLHKLAEGRSKRLESGELSVGLEAARRALYEFFDAIDAQYKRDVFMANKQNRKLSFDNLPKDQKGNLIQLIDWQHDFADFFVANAGFSADARIHQQMNDAVEDLSADAALYLEGLYGISLSEKEIEGIVRRLVQGAKAEACGINLISQITDGWRLKWGEKQDDIVKKIDAVAYDGELPICTFQFKGFSGESTRFLPALEYKRQATNRKDEEEAEKFFLGTSEIFPGAVPLYLIIGYNAENIDSNTATVHNKKFSFLETQLNSWLEK